MIYPPKNKELILLDVEIGTIARYINWTYFFNAWRVAGKYDGIENLCLCKSCETAWLQKITADKREKAKEALKLLRDAQACLQKFQQKNHFL